MTIDPVAPVIDADNTGSETVTLTQPSADDNGVAAYSWSIDAEGIIGESQTLSYDFPIGTTTVTLIVTDTIGQQSRTTVDVVVEAAPVQLSINAFGNDITADVISYTLSQDVSGTIESSNQLKTLKMNGNNWKAIDLTNVTITANTILEFDYSSTSEGEIQGIGFDSDANRAAGSFTQEHIFRVFGRDPHGIEDYNDYETGSTKTYSIPVGQFFTGGYRYLTFINDEDANGQDAESVFSNIRLYHLVADTAPVAIIDPVATVTDTDHSGSEAVTLTQGSTDDNGIASYSWSIDSTEVGTADSLTYNFPVGTTTVTLTVIDTIGQTSSTTADVVVEAGPELDSDGDGLPDAWELENFGNLDDADPTKYLSIDAFGEEQIKQIITYDAEQDVSGTAVSQDLVKTIKMNGNVWKALDLTQLTITEDTILEFEFSSSVEGEIHAIGFDNDLTLSPDRSFALHGSQDWGIRDYVDYSSGTITYSIPVGQFYSGDFRYLFFIGDDDANEIGEGIFSNIRIIDAATPSPAQTASSHLPSPDSAASSNLSAVALELNPVIVVAQTSHGEQIFVIDDSQVAFDGQFFHLSEADFIEFAEISMEVLLEAYFGEQVSVDSYEISDLDSYLPATKN